MLSFLKREKNIFLVLFIYYIFIAFIAPQTAHHDLKGFFLPWIKSFLETGVQNVYKNPLINYPPITIYVLYGFGYISQLLHLSLDSTIVYLRQVVFLFDLGTFYFFIKIMQRFKLPLFTIIFFFCNVALIYNTIFWAQLDAIYTFFVVFSVYCVVTRRPLLSSFALVCALASKPQAFIFIPVIGLLLLPYFVKDKKLILYAFLIGLVTLLVLFFPYLYYGTLADYFQIIKKTTDYYPFVSMFAYNYWLLLFGIDKISHIPDLDKFFGVSYRVWGLGMFALWNIALLFPVFTVVKSHWKHRRAFTHLEWQVVFLALTQIALAFFFFSTQMHERYAHAAIVFAAIFALVSRRYYMYAVLSIAYLVNLTALHNGLSFNLSQFIKPHIVALAYGMVLIYGTIELYWLRYKSDKEDKELSLTNQHK